VIGDRIFAGGVKDTEQNFTFEVYAYRKLTKPEVRWHFEDWLRKRDKRKSLKNKTVRMTSNLGM
jgi:hypothetical protein